MPAHLEQFAKLPTFLAVLAVGCAVAVGGCGDDDPASNPSPSEDVRETPEDDLDPNPEGLDGSESLEFEEDDLEAAGDADRLVELYCVGSASEAQFEGCLGHVDVDTVCEQDTDAKTAAVEEYIGETGDDAICE